MRTTQLLRAAALALPILLMASCHSQKHATTTTDTKETASFQQADFLKKVSDNALTTEYVTAKMKFNIELGSQQVPLSGTLRMKRDDVIRLQLMAFGLVEAARMEFTKDEVLIMDRINKQYVRAPYKDVSFLQTSGINFYMLQALFWDELFVPGKKEVDESLLERFKATQSDDNVVIRLDDKLIDYSWTVNRRDARIKSANIAYRDLYKGSTELNWNYLTFDKLGQQQFPNAMQVTLNTTGRKVRLDIGLSNLASDSDWETRTKVSDKFTEVSVEELLKRITSL